jgi:hypothetical protein
MTLLHDPFRFLDPARQRGRGLLALLPAGGRADQAQFPELEPEEAQPLKDQLLQRTVSGLHYIGGTLNKLFGGRAIRGALGGKPREILSAIPGSDTLGITDPNEEVTGEQLLNKWGYHPKYGNWVERNLAGPALEMALDPGTYLSFGPKYGATALGKVLQRGGHVAGWTHPALMKGFEATESGLRALGHGEEAIQQMALAGKRIASPAAEAAARGAGFTGELAGAPLSGFAGVSLPFRDTLFSVGHGPLSQLGAAAFDVAKKAIGTSLPVRHLRAMLDPKVGRESHLGAALAHETGMVPTRDAMEAMARYGEWGQRRRFNDMMAAVGHVPGFEAEAHNVIRGLAERVPQFRDPARAAADLALRHGRNVAPGVTDPTAVSAAIRAHFPTLQAVGDEIRQRGKAIYDEAVRSGLPLQDLGDDWADYALRRYIADTPSFQGTDEARFLATTSGSNLRRSVRLKDVAGGTPQLQAWAMDPDLVGPARLGAADIHQRLVDDLSRNRLYDHPTGLLSPTELRQIRGKASSLATWLAEVPHGHAGDLAAGRLPIPYFAPDVIADLHSRGLRHARTMGAGQALYAGIKGMAQPMSAFADPNDAVDLFTFLRKHAGLEKSGLHFERPLTADHLAQLRTGGFADRAHARGVGEIIQSTPAGTPPLVSPAELAGWNGLGPDLQARLTRENLWAPGVHAHMALAGRPGISSITDIFNGAKDPAAELAQYALHRRDANVLGQSLQNWITPSEMKPFLGWLKSNQNFFKNMVYPISPASHVRNMLTAVYNNFLHGSDIQDYLDALRIQHGRGVQGARYAPVAHLGPQEAARELMRLAYAHGKVGGGAGFFAERLGAPGLGDLRLHEALEGTRRLTPHTPGMAPYLSLGNMATAPGAWNPLHQGGVGGGVFHQAINRMFRGGAEALPYAEDRFVPLILGRAAGTQIEDTVRLANYLGNLRQGMAPANAGLLTKAIHFDYSDLSATEQNALKNVIPFYTFLRKNLPYQLEMALERPSAVSPALRAMGVASGREWVPEYLASGAAIPVGEEQEGQQRYLASLGSPLEEAFGHLKFRGNLPDVGQTLLGLAGSINPMLKGPAEWLTNTQFFSGRRLSDLDTHGPASLWGRIPEDYARPIAHLLANLPTARLVTEARTWSDPRKTYGDALLRSLTGFRFSDVDVARQRAIAARKELEANLSLDPRIASFTNYFPRRDAGELPPDLIQRLRLFTLMKNEAKAAALARERQRRETGSP